ncbi:hypothetical protein K458DRAFT_439015 [Lentithecium fluviatile CBS 122367]|uniref:Uncharacterized protein n=1 Tax=Lentithecium fluviatile CBS 122367 TaxID=1168545 RepID=A0A6G1JI35_9PLEO|nr:hypothetical protein K458DRAFT_439015 [Lentithecium fluviatile CBS 122367]
MAIDKCPRRPQKRPTKELSWELASHSKAYLEAEQYAQGYNFLHSLLGAGNSISNPAKPYVGFLAPAVQLALASTLIVYPHITTKTRSADAIKGSDAALRYLRCVQQTLDGPAYRTIRRAFSFTDNRRGRRDPKRDPPSPSQTSGSDVEHLSGLVANAQSIFCRGEDFWHVVGWAFNCSVTHKKRWARWKLWLEVMLDFLEADWDGCMRDGREDSAKRDSILQESLIWQYINHHDLTKSALKRRITRAVLAAGDAHSRTHYHEVWQNETAELMPIDEKKKPVGNVDFDTGEVGDYDSEDEDVVMQDTPRRSKRRMPTKLSDGSPDREDGSVTPGTDALGRLGGAEAVQLRQRFIALLALVAQKFPAEFTDLEGFFDSLTEEVKTLPVTSFEVMMSTSRMPPLSQVTLNANSFLPILCGKSTKRIHNVPSQADFEGEILILTGATQSFALNAKMSLIVEQLFFYMMDNDLLEATERLRIAVEHGIRERQSVYGSGTGKKGNAREEEQGRVVMHAASERLLGLLEVLEMSAGKKPQPRKEKSELLLFASFGSSLSSAPESESDDDD